jgi:hypothetical protein
MLLIHTMPATIQASLGSRAKADHIKPNTVHLALILVLEINVVGVAGSNVERTDWVRGHRYFGPFEEDLTLQWCNVIHGDNCQRWANRDACFLTTPHVLLTSSRQPQGIQQHPECTILQLSTVHVVV